MKKQLPHVSILLLLLLTTSAVHAQWDDGLWVEKQANNWYFGKGGLNFDTEPPTSMSNSQSTAIESAGTISDADGNLLFYTDGETVWNKNHQVMQNGTGLDGDKSSTQSGLVIPKPNSSTIYYIITADRNQASTPPGVGLKYTEVDMSLANGAGAVTANKNVLLSAGSDEKMSAIYSSDHSKIWLVGHSRNEFMAFLIDQNGINTTPVISTIGSFGHLAGQMKISPNGKKIAIGTPIGFANTLELFDFDATTGEVTNLIDLGSYEGAYGVEFSPNSKYLYVAPYRSKTIRQFDISLNTQAAILNSVIEFFGSGRGRLGQLQLASNGKIYFHHNNFIGVINYPNNPGLASGFIINDINTEGHDGLPDFIANYFESGILHDGHCAGEEVTFSTLRIPGIESADWDFGDPGSGADNTVTTTDGNSSHVFSAPGTYTVTATITSNGAQQTAITEIEILSPPDAFPPENLVACEDSTGNAVFDLTQQDAVILGNQDPNTHTVSYHLTQNDAENNTNPITNPTTYVSSGETIYARVTTTAGCYAVTQFELEIAPLPQLPGNLELTACPPIDLTEINDAVQADLSLSYYLSQTDAENGANAIMDSTAYPFLGNEASIYLRGESAAGCVDVAELRLIKEGCFIPQGISPNGDQWNQSFDLSYLNIQNLEIFNRYGRSVFNKESYTNEWFGQTDNGDELPTGTYFYVIKLEEGETFQNKNVLTGWVYVNREVR